MNRALFAASVVTVFLVDTWATAAAPTKRECVAADDAAQDLRQAGKLRAARDELAVCVVAACPGPVREDCAQRLDEVNKIMPTLVLDARDSAGTDLVAVRVMMDGAVLTSKLDGGAVAVDPGEHRLVFEADGHAAAEQTIVVREGDKSRHVRVVLASPPAADRDAPVTADSPADDHPEAPRMTDTTSPGSAQRTFGLVLGGAGAIGLVVGGVFGVLARSTYDGAVGCPSACTDSGYRQGQSAFSQAMVSNVAIVAGAAFVGAGAIVYFTAPKVGTLSIGPTVGAGGAGLGVSGVW